MAINYQTQLYANNASTTTVGTISPTDVTIPVSDASRFPTPSAGTYFLATLDDGFNIEVIAVYGRSGNTLTGCIRGQESTLPRSFAAGTRIENRVTAGTLEQFLRGGDRLTPISALTELVRPSASNNSSYVITQADDAGNPLIAIATSGKWRFTNYPVRILTAASDITGTTTSVAYTGVNLPSLFVTSGMVIQFTSGVNSGQCRMVSSVTSTRVNWIEPLPYAPASGDTFEVYQSLSSRLTAIEASLVGGAIGGGP